MQLENTFTIDAPIDKAWEALNTPQTIAPCFPGATLTEYEGNTFTGTVKVKLGPISLTYKGTGTYKERDDTAHRVVIDAKGRDARGNGTAEATVTGSMVGDGDSTKVTMVTDMKITGRPAQFGRGVISDVADKIIGQFASCVASKLQPEAAPAETAESSASEDSEPATTPMPAAVPAGGSSNGAATAGASPSGPALSSTPAASASKPSPTVRPVGPMKSEIDAIDLLDHAGAPVVKRLIPVAVGGILLFLIIFLIRRARG